MSQTYRIKAPCVYAIDGKAVQHKHSGAVVSLPDDVAKRLGDAVEPIGAPKLEAPARREHPRRHKSSDEPSVAPEGKDNGDQ